MPFHIRVFEVYHIWTLIQKSNEVVNPVFLQKFSRGRQGQIAAVWVCMFSISLINVFVECHNSACRLYICVIKTKKTEQRMHTGISSYLPTGRAGDTTMVWVRLTHNTERREAEEQNRGTEKEKNENQKWMRWSRVSIHEIQGKRVEFSHRTQVMARALTLGKRLTNAKNHLLNGSISNNCVNTYI